MSDTKLREKADALIAFTQQGPRFIAWVEAVTDSIAPAPEKVAKVETMAETMADRIAADLKAGTFRGEQPAPPEPAAREMPEAVRVDHGELPPRTLKAGESVPYDTHRFLLWLARWEPNSNLRGQLLDWAEALEVWRRTHAAQPGRGLPKVRELITELQRDFLCCTHIAASFYSGKLRAAQAELDAQTGVDRARAVREASEAGEGAGCAVLAQDAVRAGESRVHAKRNGVEDDRSRPRGTRRRRRQG